MYRDEEEYRHHVGSSLPPPPPPLQMEIQPSYWLSGGLPTAAPPLNWNAGIGGGETPHNRSYEQPTAYGGMPFGGPLEELQNGVAVLPGGGGNFMRSPSPGFSCTEVPHATADNPPAVQQTFTAGDAWQQSAVNSSSLEPVMLYSSAGRSEVAPQPVEASAPSVGGYATGGSHHRPNLTISLPPTEDPPLWRNEEEEDEESATAVRAGTQQKRDASVHLHPAIVASRQRLHPDYSSGHTLDPVTAALLRQHQQVLLGEPRSPLSPCTLQALYAATARGCQGDLLSRLTADDVLAPPPLALTWYPPVEAGTTSHEGRKRDAAAAMLGPQAETRGPCRGISAEEPDAIRRRMEDYKKEEELQVLHVAEPGDTMDSVGDTTAGVTAGSATGPSMSCWCSGGKRRREDCVYEFETKGPRLN